MGNTFGAHIFKRRQVGEREEVTIKLFNPDGSPFTGGTPPDPTPPFSLLDVFKGDYDADVDYSAGELVRYQDSTWLALVDAPSGSGALAPGSSGELETVQVVRQSNGTSLPGYILPRDVEVPLADLVKQPGYYMTGASAYFRVYGTPGEHVTLTVTGSDGSIGGQVLHPYLPNGLDLAGSANYTSPQTYTIPAEGYFGLEVFGGSISIHLVGEAGPQPTQGNPWVLFA
jgi:hypothetical protein